MLKKTLVCLLLLCLSPLLAAFALLAVIVLAARRLYGWALLRWRSWRSGNWRYLVCSQRAGWHEFVINNLLPALPPGVSPIWVEYGRAPSNNAAVASILHCGAARPKPYLAEVGPLRTRVRPLHEELLPFKQFGRADHEVQRLLCELLRAKLALFAK
jgi:hypothetical protein